MKVAISFIAVYDRVNTPDYSDSNTNAIQARNITSDRIYRIITPGYSDSNTNAIQACNITSDRIYMINTPDYADSNTNAIQPLHSRSVVEL